MSSFRLEVFHGTNNGDAPCGRREGRRGRDPCGIAVSRLRPAISPAPACPASQLATHADGRLAAFVIAGDASELPVPEPLIERLPRAVPHPHLQKDRGDPGDESRLLEPLHEPASDASSLVVLIDTEKIQVRVVIAVAHDSKARDPIPGTSNDHDRIRTSNTGGDPSGRPGPSQPHLDQISRHEGDLDGVGYAREPYRDLGACHHRSIRDGGQSVQQLFVSGNENARQSPVVVPFPSGA